MTEDECSAERAKETAEAISVADEQLRALSLAAPSVPAFLWDVERQRPPDWLWTWALWSLDDCNYIVAMSPDFADTRFMFDSATPFACYKTESHRLPSGWTLVAGYHA